MCSAGFMHGQEDFVAYAEVEPEWPHQGKEGTGLGLQLLRIMT